jgi:DnaJ-class molecular chaperone
VTRVHVTFTEAALGGDVTVPTLADDERAQAPKITLPAGTQSGAVFTLKAQGIPRLDGRGRGALIAVVQVDVPTELSARARDLLAALDVELRPTPAPAVAPATAQTAQVNGAQANGAQANGAATPVSNGPLPATADATATTSPSSVPPSASEPRPPSSGGCGSRKRASK